MFSLSRPRRGPLGGPFAPGRHRGSTYLPIGRPGPGTPVPRLVPRQRPGLLRRPASLPVAARAAPPRSLPSQHTRASARPDPRLGSARDGPQLQQARAVGFLLFLQQRERENKSEQELFAHCAHCAVETLERVAPPGSACGRHFVPLKKKRPGHGGHFGTHYSAAVAPLTFTKNSAAATAAASSGSGRRGRGGRGGERKTKKGEGRGGRSRERLETFSSEESLLQPPPGTRRHLHRAPARCWR